MGAKPLKLGKQISEGSLLGAPGLSPAGASEGLSVFLGTGPPWIREAGYVSADSIPPWLRVAPGGSQSQSFPATLSTGSVRPTLMPQKALAQA